MVGILAKYSEKQINRPQNCQEKTETISKKMKEHSAAEFGTVDYPSQMTGLSKKPATKKAYKVVLCKMTKAKNVKRTKLKVVSTGSSNRAKSAPRKKLRSSRMCLWKNRILRSFRDKKLRSSRMCLSMDQNCLSKQLNPVEFDFRWIKIFFSF